MRTIIILLFTFLTAFVFAQAPERYQELTQQAHEFYKSKNYLASAQKYNEALTINGEKSFSTTRYDAACSWALANMPDSAFPHLVQLVEDNEIKNYSYFKDDSNLKSLQSDKRWGELLDLIQQKKDEAEKDFDRPLKALLDSIHNEDQGYRIEIEDIEKKYGRESVEMKKHWKKIQFVDSMNLIVVTKILDERGWLGSNIVGKDGNHALFLVIQHSNQITQEKYLPIMREAVKNGDAEPGDLALLEDRVALGQGKKQIYGSQYWFDKFTGKDYMFPLEDPENVDKRRAEVGLLPLSDYLRNMEIIWNVEQYQKEHQGK